ncbi:MAG: phenylalanine--tRNA ligase subunit beta [Spirochaetia bacterium]|nr:phenylalanine--tRNA ligase subunit beta [Spirochaetia bacterium]
MPKIEVSAEALYKYMGKKVTGQDFIDLIQCAKAELDEENGDVLKIELNDTNRPDLWSTAGFGRILRMYLGGSVPEYPFFSRKGDMKDSGDRIVDVDASVKDIRPYEVAFAVRSKTGITEDGLKDIIQTQEKLCWNYGRKRKSIAMGVFRSDLIKYPIHFYAADPDTTKFAPLGFEEEMSLREILKKHPKGVEFGHLLDGMAKFPYIVDANKNTLSMPPVINSNYIGAVKVGDKDLFVEITGTDMPSLMLTASIVACDFYDSGFEILPVKVRYPYDTPFGREVTVPYYFQEPVTVDIKYVNKLLGEKFTVSEAAAFCQKLGSKVKVDGDIITVYPAEYRNDFLHSVDAIEDIMIGKGLKNFVPEMPSDFTKGSISRESMLGRKIKNIMVGLGFQEMAYCYLGSAADYIQKMNITPEKVVQISNPMTENFEFVRPSVLPCLLNSESISSNAVYPHNIFEIGKIALIDPSENYGVKTINSLGFLSADKEAGFNSVNSEISALLYYSGVEYELEETEDPRFISGRCAKIMAAGKEIGIMGEVNPVVLENWGIQVPCTAGELNLDLILENK